MSTAGRPTPESRVRTVAGENFWNTMPLGPDGVRVVMTDGPHGVRRQVGGGDALDLDDAYPATCFPTASALASSWDRDLLGRVGAALGAEAAALGVHVLLGPGMNIKRHPLCGRNFEYLSEDPLVSGTLATSLVRGIQSTGIGATLKHFAVNNQESFRYSVDAVLDERTLRELYLRGFEIAVRESEPWMVMCSYNSINGTTASCNRTLLTTILREEWGFDGVVVSDWAATGPRAEALKAGLDLEMPGSELNTGELLRDSERDAATAFALDRSLARLESLAAKVSTYVEHTGIDAEIIAEHDALAAEAAAGGAVLLANDGILPIDDYGSLGVIGEFAESPRYQGAGSSRINSARLNSLRDALGERDIAHLFAPGYDAARPGSRDERKLAEAVAVARGCETVVLVAGLPAAAESEGVDRTSFALPQQQLDLIEAVTSVNSRTIVFLCNGSPVDLEWISKTPPAAVVEAYLGGQASGRAIVNILFGDAEPSGRLAESVPERLSDLRADPWFPGSIRQVQHREGLSVGYRHHATSGKAARFPFGFGLGYGAAEWSDFSLSTTSVTPADERWDTATPSVNVKIRNTGSRPRRECVQVYLADARDIAAPARALAGFASVDTAPGEEVTAEVAIIADAFHVYSPRQERWVCPPGEVTVQVGRDSADIVWEARVDVAGSDSPEGVTDERILGVDDDADFSALLGRPIPTPRPARPFTRDSTIAELQRSKLAGLVLPRLLKLVASRAGSKGESNQLLESAMREFPLRSLAAVSGGKVGWRVVDAALVVLNRLP